MGIAPDVLPRELLAQCQRLMDTTTREMNSSSARSGDGKTRAPRRRLLFCLFISSFFCFCVVRFVFLLFFPLLRLFVFVSSGKQKGLLGGCSRGNKRKTREKKKVSRVWVGERLTNQTDDLLGLSFLEVTLFRGLSRSNLKNRKPITDRGAWVLSLLQDAFAATHAQVGSESDRQRKKWVWLKIKPPQNCWFQSLFPFTRFKTTNMGGSSF